MSESQITAAPRASGSAPSSAAAVEAFITSSRVQPPASTVPPSGAAERSYIRGSSLLLAGRIISVLLNFGVQILTVRYLTKNDYGAFAYALAAVSMGSSAIHLGMEKAISRMVPIYLERRDYARVAGSVALATSTIWGLGLSLVALLHGFKSVVGSTLVSDPQSLSLLLILIALSPVGAFTTLLEKLVAIFSSPRAIFFRRHVLGPGLKLTAVLVVVLTAGGVRLLAYGYLVGGIISVCLYARILLQEWRRRGLLQYTRPSRIVLPVRELFGFSLPLFSSDLSLIVRSSLIVILLGYFHDTTAVAEFRAVLPLAGLNLLVYEAFTHLYVPLASRTFAHDDWAGISELYWQTSIWTTVLTFPAFAVTFALAEPATVLLLGERYAGAGTLLAILAFGHYVSAALGFNSASLRVHGKLGLIVGSDAVAAIAAVALSLLLIPRFGALGAAISATVTQLVHILVLQHSLRIGNTGIAVLPSRFVRVFLLTVSLSVALLLAHWLIAPPAYVSVGLVAVGTLLVIRCTRRVLGAGMTFPELLRIPLVRRLVA